MARDGIHSLEKAPHSLETTTHSLETEKVCELEPLLEGARFISMGLDFAGDLIVLAMVGEPQYRWYNEQGAAFARNESDTVHTYVVFHFRGGGVDRLELAPTRENFHFAQAMPDGSWVLARGRARDEADLNLHVYDAAGRCVRSFHVGDGIQDVQVAADGAVWLSYFDEGAFGDGGLPGHGLVSIRAADGRVLFTFPEDLPSIDDCYTLNVVAPDDVWCCYYSDFPLVRLRGGRGEVVFESAPVQGASAFAIQGGVALFCGGYGDRHRLTAVSLEDGTTRALRPVDEAGAPIPAFEGVARGGVLLLYTGTAIHRALAGEAG